MNRGTVSSGQSIAQMVQTHPQQPRMDAGMLAQHIQTLGECALTCTICADACLHEEMVQELRRCIRLNLDCAEMCKTTAGALARTGEPDAQVLRALLGACQTTCQVCGAECESHAQTHEHCRVCAETCRHCAEMCQQLLGQVG